MKRFTPLLRAASFGAMLVLIVSGLGWLLSNAGLIPTPAAPAETETPLPPSDETGTPVFAPLQTPLNFEWVSGPVGNFFYANVSTPDTALGQIEFGSLQGGWCDRSANGGVIAFVHEKVRSAGGEAGFASEPATLRWVSLQDLATVQEPFPDMLVMNPPTFSPAGFRLAFTACPADGNCGLFVFDLESGSLDRISPYQPIHPVLWSPDGTEIAFEVPSGDLAELHVISVETGTTTYLGGQTDPGSPLSSWGRPVPAGVTGVERCEAAPGLDLPEPLTMASGSEEIRMRLLYSHTFWQSMWVDAELADTSGALTSSQRTQVWLEQPARARVLSGSPGSAPALLWISDGERTRTGEEVRVEPFNPPVGEGNVVYPHPMTYILPTPLSSLLFPAGLAQRGGSYIPVELASMAGRDALVVDWQAPWGEVVDRFWIDTVTGVILRQQSSGKDSGGEITSDYIVNAIAFEPKLQPDAFDIGSPFPATFAEGPEDIHTEAAAPSPAGTPDTSLEHGEVYLVLDSSSGWGTAGMVRFPAACLVTGANCPQAEFVSGTPEGFAYAANSWSPDSSRLAYTVSGPLDEVWLYDRSDRSWTKLDAPYFSGAVWSPDGQLLAGQPVISGSASSNPIIVALSDGSGWQEVLVDAPGFKSPFGWADEHAILFVNTLDNEVSEDDPTVYSEIQLVDLQTGEFEVLAGIRSDTNTSQFGIPAISADRTRFAYTLSSWQTPSTEVHVYDLASRSEQTFILDRPASVSWAPSGDRLLVTAALGYTCSLSSIGADGTGSTELYSGDSGSGCVAVWSPDGEYLLVSEPSRDPSVPRLTVINVISGEVQTLALPALDAAFERVRAVWMP